MKIVEVHSEEVLIIVFYSVSRKEKHLMRISLHYGFICSNNEFLLVSFPASTCLTRHGRVVSGDRRPAAVQGTGVWRDDGQEEALWLARPGPGQIRLHGERLLSVSTQSRRRRSAPPGAQSHRH